MHEIVMPPENVSRDYDISSLLGATKWKSPSSFARPADAGNEVKSHIKLHHFMGSGDLET